MKKRFWGILIAVVILAIGLPRIISDGLSSLSSPEEKKKVEQLEEKLRQGLRPLDKLMVQGYEAKPNGNQWNIEEQKSEKNYRITYYTFFGIRYAEGETSGAGAMITLPDLPFS